MTGKKEERAGKTCSEGPRVGVEPRSPAHAAEQNLHLSYYLKKGKSIFLKLRCQFLFQVTGEGLDVRFMKL